MVVVLVLGGPLGVEPSSERAVRMRLARGGGLAEPAAIGEGLRACIESAWRTERTLKRNGRPAVEAGELTSLEEACMLGLSLSQSYSGVMIRYGLSSITMLMPDTCDPIHSSAYGVRSSSVKSESFELARRETSEPLPSLPHCARWWGRAQRAGWQCGAAGGTWYILTVQRSGKSRLTVPGANGRSGKGPGTGERGDMATAPGTIVLPVVARGGRPPPGAVAGIAEGEPFSRGAFRSGAVAAAAGGGNTESSSGAGLLRSARACASSAACGSGGGLGGTKGAPLSLDGAPADCAAASSGGGGWRKVTVHSMEPSAF